MHAVQFLKSRPAGPLPPVIMALGAEAVLQEAVVELIVRAALGDDREMGFTRLDAATVKLRGVLDVLASGGLFSDRRVVMVRNAGELETPAGTPILSDLETWLANPDESVTLILLAEKVPANRHPFKMLLKSATTVECDPLKGEALKNWLRDHLTARGFAIDRGALEIAIDLLGNDLGIIRNAFEKVMLYCGDRRHIGPADIELNFGIMREHATWELTAAIGARDASRALAVLAHLLDEGKHPLVVLTTLQIHLRQLITVKSLLGKRMSAQDIGVAAGIRFYVERSIEQAKAFSAAELMNAYDVVFAMENGIKSAGVDERYILERGVIAICG